MIRDDLSARTGSPAAGGDFLAIDWGTTNRRIYRFDAGGLTHAEHDSHGVSTCEDFEAAIAELRLRFGQVPILMAGMVGSSLGWKDAGYVLAPAGLNALAQNLFKADTLTAIVPGMRTASPADIMRGEEVQFLGAARAGLVPDGAALVQPGTHSKWALLAGGQVTRFASAMTGELFALLRQHSILAGQLRAPATIGPTFIDGLEEAQRNDLATSLFRVRAAGLFGERADVDAASYVSGILIGADVQARLAEFAHPHFHVIADPVLGALYAAAIAHFGRGATIIDSQTAFVAGIREIASQWII